MGILIRNELPKRLKDQREGIGYSIGDLAERTRLSPETLQEFENGVRLPAVHQLNKIGWALGIDPMILLESKKRAVDLKRLPARFRAQEGAVLAPDDVRLLSIAAELGRVGYFLWRLLERKRPGLTPGSTPLSEEHAGKEGARLGVKARMGRVWPKAGPILDLKGALEKVGVHVAWAQFSDPLIDGASLVEPNALPVILLNVHSKRVTNPSSARMVLAHELCHLLHDSQDENQRVLRSSVSVAHGPENKGSREEQRANAFAPAFLAPPDWVLEPAPTDTLQLGTRLIREWGFNPEAAAWHTRIMRGLSTEDAQALHKQLKITAQSISSPLVGDRPPRRATLTDGLLRDLAESAQQRSLISEGRLREILETR